MSDIRANTISNESGNGPINLHKQSAAKVWVNYYDHTSPTTIRDSFNVSSLEDVNTGITKMSLTSAMDNDTYQAAGAQGDQGKFSTFSNLKTVSYRQNCWQPQSTSNATDYQNTSAVHGDLA